MKFAYLLTAMLLATGLAPPAAAQDGQHSGHRLHQGPGASPYVGLQSRPIKALSEEQLSDLRSGRGAGLALAAELNGYPGPTHVLEHAVALDLTPHQHAEMERLVAEMKAETIAIGHEIIEQEAALERLFRERSVTAATLESAAARIGGLQGRLRAAHLRYHLATVQILTPRQVELYAVARGYPAAAGK